MTDLADLLADVTKDMSPAVRRTIDTAIENGWQLAKPGMTLCLRLDKPDDELAMPVYVAYTVGRTAKGKLSFRFDSCATRGLNPLSGADLLEYLADPTVVYPEPEGIEWDETKSTTANFVSAMGARPVLPDPPPLAPSPRYRRQKAGKPADESPAYPKRPSRPAAPAKPVKAGPPLRVQVPQAR